MGERHPAALAKSHFLFHGRKSTKKKPQPKLSLELRIIVSTLSMVALTIFCLWFKGGVGDVVLFELVFEMLRHLGPTSEIVNDHMRRQRRLGGANGPHVDMMHILDTLFGCE